MPLEPNTCLAAGEILAYLDGALPASRRAEAEGHLEECRLCESAIEGVTGLERREGYLSSTDSLLARVRARTATAVAAPAPRRRVLPFRPTVQYLTLAATLVLGVGAAVVLTRPGPDEALFQRYFEPYPSLRPVVRAGVRAGEASALALYERGDYRAALAAFEETLGREPNDPVSIFYAGLSRLPLGQPREAIGNLEQVLRLGGKDLQEPARWYLALAHLHGHDLAAARSQLERIVEAGGFYREKARALLTDLDDARARAR
jgi:tetratricopeptide (TPR) repeat protein